MNRRRFLGLAAATFGALLAPFRSGESRTLKPWKTLPDARPRAGHVTQAGVFTLKPSSFFATVAAGPAIHQGALLEVLPDGRLVAAGGRAAQLGAQFKALEASPASSEDRRVPVGMMP